MKRLNLTIFFPYLNDWGTIGSMVLLSASTAKRLKKSFEILVIDDGSNAMSKAALDEIKRLVPQLKVIHHPKNKGYGGALKTGFSKAKGDLIFYTDGDAQYDVRDLTKLFSRYSPGIGMVNGYKKKRHDPWYRVILGNTYHNLVKFCFRLPLRDTDCDFRLIDRSVFKRVKLFENTGTICVELVKKIHYFGYLTKEVSVNHYNRSHGVSQFFNFKRLYFTALNLFVLWWKLIIKQDYTH